MLTEGDLKIAKAVIDAEGYTPDEVSLQPDGTIYVQQSFECGEDEEPHDVAWVDYCDLSQAIRNNMPYVEITDSDSDNDTLWFTIKSKQ